MTEIIQLIVLSLIIVIVCTLIIVNRAPEYLIPKIAWMYWDEVKRPPLIEAIHLYNLKKMEGWDIRYLNKDTIHTYVDPAEYPNDLLNQRIQHQSDWYRMYLLSKYGGCWIDASIIINDPDALDSIWERAMYQRADIVFFGTSSYNEDEGTLYKTFTHAQGLDIPLVIDNWFLMCPQNSEIAIRWFDEFNTAMKMGLLAYKKQCIEDGVDISLIYFADEDDTYLTMHICIEKIMQKDMEVMPSLLIMKSCDSMFKIHQDCDWNQECIEEAILAEDSRELPYIKLMSSNRTEKMLSYF